MTINEIVVPVCICTRLNNLKETEFEPQTIPYFLPLSLSLSLSQYNRRNADPFLLGSGVLPLPHNILGYATYLHVCLIYPRQ